MVYSIGKVSVYETEPDNTVVGTQDGVWDRVEYLNPDEVDRPAASPLFQTERFGQGYAIAPETAPKAVLWKSKTKLPPDYAFGNNSIMLGVLSRHLMVHYPCRNGRMRYGADSTRERPHD